MFRNSFLIAGFAVISQILGIIRDRLLAHYVGVGPVLDIYNAAFRLPDLALGIMLSFAAAGTVVPFISHAIVNNNTKELEERFNSLFFFFGTAMIIMCTGLALLLPYLTPVLIPGFSAIQTTQYIFLTRLLLVQPILLGFSALVSCLAQARHEFVLYSIAPLLYTMAIISSIIFAYPSYGPLGIIGGVILGAFLHVSFQSITFIKHPLKIHYTHFTWKYIKEHLHLSVPRSGSYISTQLRNIFYTAFATTLGPGALSIYIFAQKIIDAVVAVLSQSFSTGSLPLLSSQIAQGDLLGYRRTLTKNLSFIFTASVIVSIVFWYTSGLLVTCFVRFEQGHRSDRYAHGSPRI
jgi:putative peptidoglycan lipid II flippase